MEWAMRDVDDRGAIDRPEGVDCLGRKIAVRRVWRTPTVIVSEIEDTELAIPIVRSDGVLGSTGS
jgi:hypothetical protein